jgi:hypothetical protein
MDKKSMITGLEGQPLGRRDFFRNMAAALAAAGTGLSAAGNAAAHPAPRRTSPIGPAVPLIGIQMGPHTMLDEGIEHVLDLIQETAAVDTVMVYSHTYHSDLKKPAAWIAPDHGVAPRDLMKRNLPSVWVKTHEEFYKNTVVRHPKLDPASEYAGRDLLAEMIEPARRRGMKVYARILEGSGAMVAERIGNYAKVRVKDVYGRPANVACWNNPDYKNFWADTAEDLFRSYDLDGFQWGAERMGPLMNVIMPWNDAAPACFCEHCLARGRAAGINVDRAREGFEKLYVYVRGLMAGDTKPAEGVFTVFLRQLLRYPEILAWEYQYRQSREDVQRAMYATIKAIKPQAQVGWHVDHQPSSWDIVYRAEMSYEEMAPYSDFIKFIAYHDVLAPRVRWWYLERLRKTVLGEISLEQSLDLYYDLFGYDKKVEPRLSELETKGFTPDYVFRETKRSVASAAGKTKIYPGIGFDVPWGRNTIPADPEKVYEAVLKAFEAGAAGIVVSREYEEMRLANLKAVGRAVRELRKA